MAALERWRHELSNVGSDAATATLGDADVGNVVRVTVSYTDGHGTAESLTSASNGGHRKRE